MFACRFMPLGEIVRHNIKTAMPLCSSSEMRNIERGYYCRACDFAAEFMHMCRPDAENPIIKFKNLDVLEDSFKSSNFVICYSGHFANYEVMTKLPLIVGDVTMYNFYQASSVKEIDSYICGIRSRYGAKLVPTDKGIKELISLRNNNQHKKVLIGSLADLRNAKNPSYVTLFGKSYAAYRGTERLGQLLDAKFLYAKMTSEIRGQYKVEFIPLEKAGYGTDCTATQAFFRCLENNVRTQPELWMLWGAYSL